MPDGLVPMIGTERKNPQNLQKNRFKVLKVMAKYDIIILSVFEKRPLDFLSRRPAFAVAVALASEGGAYAGGHGR